MNTALSLQRVGERFLKGLGNVGVLDKMQERRLFRFLQMCKASLYLRCLTENLINPLQEQAEDYKNNLIDAERR